MAEEIKVTLQNRTGETTYRPETDADKVTVTDGSTVQDVLDSLKSQVAILRKAVGSCLVFETIAQRDAMTLDAAGYTAFVRDATQGIPRFRPAARSTSLLLWMIPGPCGRKSGPPPLRIWITAWLQTQNLRRRAMNLNRR